MSKYKAGGEGETACAAQAVKDPFTSQDSQDFTSQESNNKPGSAHGVLMYNPTSKRTGVYTKSVYCASLYFTNNLVNKYK